VDEVFQPVDGGDFSFTALVGSSDDGDFVVFSDGDAADLLRKLLDSKIQLLPFPTPGSKDSSGFRTGDLIHCAFL
jgi:hypothetical protein